MKLNSKHKLMIKVYNLILSSPPQKIAHLSKLTQQAMGRGKGLSEVEKEKIDSYAELGLKSVEIAKKSNMQLLKKQDRTWNY